MSPSVTLGGLAKWGSLRFGTLPLECRVLTEGLRVGRGERAGVKLGENARLLKLDSWLIGLRGKLTILVNWLVRAELRFVISIPRWESILGGVAVIIGGGPPIFSTGTACSVAGWGIVCTGFRFGWIVSSFNRAISENTSANGWYWGPQLSK